MPNSFAQYLQVHITNVCIITEWVKVFFYTFYGRMFLDNYLCLVASNKQQIQWTRIQRNSQKPEVGSASHKSYAASTSAATLKILRRKRFRKPKN